MAKKKANKKKKNVIEIKRIAFLIFGATAVVFLFFILGYLVDYLAVKLTGPTSHDRFSILENDEQDVEPEENLTANNNAVLNKNIFSFFETLSKKEEEKTTHDIKREEAIRSHTGRDPEADSEENVQENIQKREQSSSIYAVQLGSFKSDTAAKALKDKYISKGYKAYIVSAALPGRGEMYRVRIGRFKDIKDAQEFSSELEKKEKVSAFITSK